MTFVERSTIPQHSGKCYQSWESQVRYGLIEKDFHSVVFGFRGEARKPCPALIQPLTQADLDAYATTYAANDAQRVNVADVRSSKVEYDAWMKMDMKAQAFIIKHLGPSEHMHTRNCDFAWQMWDSLKNIYELQGERGSECSSLTFGHYHD